jgi:hypothetical protein
MWVVETIAECFRKKQRLIHLGSPLLVCCPRAPQREESALLGEPPGPSQERDKQRIRMVGGKDVTGFHQPKQSVDIGGLLTLAFSSLECLKAGPRWNQTCILNKSPGIGPQGKNWTFY